MEQSAKSLSGLPAEMVDHILSFLDIEDRSRFSMTCRKFYDYRAPINLYEIRLNPRTPPRLIIKKLLELGVPRRRITRSPEPRIVVLHPLIKCTGALPKQKKIYDVRIWLTPKEKESYDFPWELVPIQPGAPNVNVV